jgi:hypothetical protein
MEGYLRHLVILQLRGGNLRGGRDGLNQLVVHSNDNLYLELLNLLNEGMMKDSADNLQRTCQQMIQGLGGLDLEDPSSDSLPSGCGFGFKQVQPSVGPPVSSPFLIALRKHLPQS